MMQSKRELWAGHVAAWQFSGLSQAAWCRQHGVSLASFGYWRDKLAVEARSALPAVLPIRVDTPVGTAVIELRFRSGVAQRKVSSADTYTSPASPSRAASRPAMAVSTSGWAAIRT